MKIDDICRLVEECFELEKGSVRAETTSKDLTDWDSLGHFALLEFLESQMPGVLDRQPGLAQAGSIQELFDLGLGLED